MSILREDGVIYVKGAIETIVALSSAGTAGGVEAAREMAARGLRVLAVAVGDGPEEVGLRMLGVVGIADPPRTEAIEAVAAARRAGIRTVMITGDHPLTASAVAREMGIVTDSDTEGEVVHARASPEDKLKIVRFWKSRGEVVAMTGDGVNDAPALREAHIGIAMGRSGTAVTREASEMILADDNFASIVAAIREGRGIFENIRKSLLYLLAGNTGELALMLAAAIVGLPLPFLPLQILWINLITDGFPALALVMDPPDADILSRAPRRPDEPMLGRPEWFLILRVGLMLAAPTFIVFLWALAHRSLAEARTLVFSTLVFGQVFMALAFRSRNKLLWEVGPFTNLRLLAVVAISILLQVGLLLIPAAQKLFQMAQLSAAAGAFALLCGLAPISLIELAKLARRRRPGTRAESRPS
jgi:Ca2+-transporting ATPase